MNLQCAWSCPKGIGFPVDLGKERDGRGQSRPTLSSALCNNTIRAVVNFGSPYNVAMSFAAARVFSLDSALLSLFHWYCLSNSQSLVPPD